MSKCALYLHAILRTNTVTVSETKRKAKHTGSITTCAAEGF